MNKLFLIVGGLAVLVIVALIAVSGMNDTAAPETDSEPTAQTADMQTDEEMNQDQNGDTIVDVAVNAGSFTTLVTALQEAGLVETLSGEGPYTVFAPTDEAFAKLPEGTLEALLQDKERLTQILTYHVVPGRVMAQDVVNLSSATTVQGQEVTIGTSNGTVMVNDATVVQTDIEASNGVIHVIDTVLMPTE